MDSTSIHAPRISAARRAFEGFTGPLDKVQSGDFAEALRLLDYLVGTDPDTPDYKAAAEEARSLLQRLEADNHA